MIEAALSMAKVRFAHDRWANEQLLNCLKEMTAEQYATTPCSGNGSIAQTVAHMILVQQSWIAWLSGTLPLEQAFAVVKQIEEVPDVETARERWKDVDEQATAYLDSLTEQDFVTEKKFSLPSGLKSSLPLWQMLLQITSHGVHTRGQIVSAIRSAGMKPAEVSFLQFCMKARQEMVAEDEPEG